MVRYLALTLCWIGLFQSSCGQDNAIPTITAMELKDQMNGQEVVVFDVRRPEEIEKGVINSEVLNYDFYQSDFKNKVSGLDKDKTYYVYCHAGGRSAKTVKMMQELGFESVYNVAGGITKWREDGNKTVPIKP